MSKAMTRTGNRIGAWMYRALDGRRASGSTRVTLLLLTVPGRKTGQPHSVCVRYLLRDGGFLVWGTASGATEDPDWFRNLRAAEASGETADVKVRGGHFTIRRRELQSDERSREWQFVLEEAPEVEKYARRAGRTIPMAVLEVQDVTAS